jgi:hypothetical protein
MGNHNDISLRLIPLDPLGLFEKAGALITKPGPMMLGFPEPGIGVALGVRQNNQGEEFRARSRFVAPDPAGVPKVIGCRLGIRECAE